MKASSFERIVENALRGLFSPSILFRLLWRKFKVGSFELRCQFDAINRPHYAFGAFHAAKLARALGLKSMSLVEFGVARGEGLLNLEELAGEISRTVGIEIEVYGFDTTVGLPAPQDYRDLLYIWKQGDFIMDQDYLKNKLRNARLVVGNVKDTVASFFETYKPAPIGFVAFDLDFYSSTRDALKIFLTEDEYILPRVLCYFDDILDEQATQLFNDFTGELLAIKEFNDGADGKKLCKVNGLSQKRYFKSSWPEAIYAMHAFKHKLYDNYVL